MTSDWIGAEVTPESELCTNAQPRQILRTNDPDCRHGWYLDFSDHVRLCPDTCALARSDPSAELEILAGCFYVDLGP